MLAAVYRSVLFHDDSKLFVFSYIAAAVVLAIWLGLFWLAMVVLVHLLLEMVKQRHYDPRMLPAVARSLWELKLDIGLVVCGLVIGLYIDMVFGVVGLSAAGRAGAQAAARVGLWQRGLRGVMLTVDDVAIVAKARGVGNKQGEAGEEAELAVIGARARVDDADADMPRAARAGEGNTVETGHAGRRGPGASDGEEQVKATGSGRAHGDVTTTSVATGPPHRPPVAPAGGPELWGGWAAMRWSTGDRLSLAFTAGNVLLLVVAPLLTGEPAAAVWADVLADLRPFPRH